MHGCRNAPQTICKFSIFNRSGKRTWAIFLIKTRPAENFFAPPGAVYRNITILFYCNKGDNVISSSDLPQHQPIQLLLSICQGPYSYPILIHRPHNL